MNAGARINKKKIRCNDQFRVEKGNRENSDQFFVNKKDVKSSLDRDDKVHGLGDAIGTEFQRDFYEQVKHSIVAPMT